MSISNEQTLLALYSPSFTDRRAAAFTIERQENIDAETNQRKGSTDLYRRLSRSRDGILKGLKNPSQHTHQDLREVQKILGVDWSEEARAGRLRAGVVSRKIAVRI